MNCSVVQGVDLRGVLGSERQRQARGEADHQATHHDGLDGDRRAAVGGQEIAPRTGLERLVELKLHALQRIEGRARVDHAWRPRVRHGDQRLVAVRPGGVVIRTMLGMLVALDDQVDLAVTVVVRKVERRRSERGATRAHGVIPSPTRAERELPSSFQPLDDAVSESVSARPVAPHTTCMVESSAWVTSAVAGLQSPWHHA